MFNLVGFLKGLLIEDTTDRTKQFILQISPSATTGTATTITAAQTANRSITLPDNSDVILTASSTATLTNKTISGSNNTLSNIALTSLASGPDNEFIVYDGSGVAVAANAVPAGTVVGTTDAQTLTNKSIDATTNILTNISDSSIAASANIALTKLAPTTANVVLESNGSGVISPSAVTITTLGFLDATSSIQTQLNSKSTVSGSLVNGDIVVGAGASSVKTTGIAVDGSNNITGANSASIGQVTIAVGSVNKISTNTNSALLLSNGGTSNQIVTTDKPFQIQSPTNGLAGQLIMNEDQASGHNTNLTIQPADSMLANRTWTFPDTTDTFAGAASTQTFTNKTFGDAITATQIVTPSNPSSGKDKLYFKADDNLYSLTSSGIETQFGSSVAPVGVVAQNYLVNSAFDFWQVGTSATVTATGGATPTPTYLYQPDQWYVNNILGGTGEGVITFSQVTGVLNGSKFGAFARITTAPTGSGIQNGLEIYQTLSNQASLPLYGKTASFSVQVLAAHNVTQVGIQFYYSTSESKVTVAIGSEILTTINSSTFTLCSINGQALGTAQTTSGVIGVRIRPTAVSSGNLYDVTNGLTVEQGMLNLGSTAAAFSRQYNSPAQELVSCQYFYEKSYNITTAPGTVTNVGASVMVAASSNPIGFDAYKVTKRITPSATYYSPATLNASGKVRNVTVAADIPPSSNFIGQANQSWSGSVADTSEITWQWTADARI